MEDKSSVKVPREKRTAARKPRLALPYSGRKSEPGEWVYNHRAGIFITLIVYLAITILFVSSRIAIMIPERSAGILIDLKTLEELEAEKQRLEREVRMRQLSSYASVRNAVSNERAELRDDRNTDMSALRERAEGLDDKMQSNRDAWEQGMRELDAMVNRRNEKDKGENSSADSRRKGNVTVSFSLVNPLRYSSNLVIPAYRCEKGGQVVVSVIVDRRGVVTSASVDKSRSDNDACMHTTAVESALASRFTVDTSAPERHSGTITYIFIPQ